MSAFFGSLNCCGGSAPDDCNDDRPSLQISGPTNFRREEVKLAGLSEVQQRFLREKAENDARRMWLHLQPLASSPSSTFATRPTPSCTGEAFKTPQRAPTTPEDHPALLPPIPTRERRGSIQARLDRVRPHSRKISDVLVGSGRAAGEGYEAPGQGVREGENGLEEMREFGERGRGGREASLSEESSEGEKGGMEGRKF